GQVDVDSRALAGLARYVDMSIALSYEPVGHAQPQAGALACLLGREERFEDLLEHAVLHAAPGTRETELDIFARLDSRNLACLGSIKHHIACVYREDPLPLHGVTRVQGQVEHHILEMMCIDIDIPGIRRHLDVEPDHLAERVMQQLV